VKTTTPLERNPQESLSDYWERERREEVYRHEWQNDLPAYLAHRRERAANRKLRTH